MLNTRLASLRAKPDSDHVYPRCQAIHFASSSLRFLSTSLTVFTVFRTGSPLRGSLALAVWTVCLSALSDCLCCRCSQCSLCSLCGLCTQFVGLVQVPVQGPVLFACQCRSVLLPCILPMRSVCQSLNANCRVTFQCRYGIVLYSLFQYRYTAVIRLIR